MKQIIKNFTKYKYLLVELIKKDITLKYRRSYLGILWTLIEPFLTMLVLTVVFSQLYGKEDQAFPVYILSGRLLYSFFSGATKAAMRSMRVNGQMIKKVYVPKYIYPLSSVLAQFVTFLISLIVLILVAIYLRIKPSVYILHSIIPLLILLIMSIGVGLILATLAVFFRDMEYLWGVILMLIMYCSAIFYEPSRLIKRGHEWILKINPLYSIIQNFRNTVMYASPLSREELIYSLAFSLLALVVGTIMFYKSQDKFILYL